MKTVFKTNIILDKEAAKVKKDPKLKAKKSVFLRLKRHNYSETIKLRRKKLVTIKIFVLNFFGGPNA